MFTSRRSRHHIYLRFKSREIIGRGTTIECLCSTIMLTEDYPDNDKDYTTYIFIKKTHENSTTRLPLFSKNIGAYSWFGKKNNALIQLILVF